MIGIIDYGIGNITSLTNLISLLKLDCVVTKNVSILKRCKVIIMPGVGTFQTAIKSIRINAIDKFLIEHQKEKKIIGICLGMQLLTERSQENGHHNGIGLLNGEIVKFNSGKTHIGWNKLEIKDKSSFLSEFAGEYFYFNHSFILQNSSNMVAESLFTEKFDSIVLSNRIIGLQFHPEKSQSKGKELFKRLLLN